MNVKNKLKFLNDMAVELIETYNNSDINDLLNQTANYHVITERWHGYDIISDNLGQIAALEDEMSPKIDDFIEWLEDLYEVSKNILAEISNRDALDLEHFDLAGRLYVELETY